MNIFQVQLEIEEQGWRLLSDEYINLKEPLSLICPKGHNQQISFGTWRKKHICEVCLAGDPKHAKRGSIPDKNESTFRLLALDAATNVSGYSIYDDGVLVNFGLFKAKKQDTIERINDVKHWLIEMIEKAQPDFVGIENIQLQMFGGNKNSPQVEMYRVLANLQGVLMDTCYELDIPCELTYSSQWRRYCGITGTGRENKKKAAQDKVYKWYGIECTQDEADAICIGKYFAQREPEIEMIEGSWS